MKNQFVRLIAVFAVVVLLAGAGSSFAQNSSSGSGSAAVEVEAEATLSVPAGYTVIPPKDSDRFNDQIVQLENLTIQKISGSVPGVIYASRDLGGSCREYFDVQGTSGSRIYPCPLAPTVLYQISLQSDTILLLKDRTRARISDFEVGDRINVFGFMDRGTSGVQALIVRDLDKPAVSRYVQLNDLTVVSDPTSSVPPASFSAARRGVEPCLSFDSVMSVRGSFAPCPLGVDVSTSAEALKSPEIAQLYRPFREYYTIHVTAATRLMNVNRQPISLSDIQSSDRVNVYGRYIPGTRVVEALIVRDLSVPRSNVNAGVHLISPNGGERIRIGSAQAVSWNFPRFGTIPAGYSVVLSLLDGPSQGGVVATLDSSAANAKSYRWAVENIIVGGDAVTFIQPGTYRLKIDLYDGTPCLGFCIQPVRAVNLVASDTSDGYFQIVAEDDEDAPSISSVNLGYGSAGDKITLRGDFDRSGNYVYLAGHYIGSSAGGGISSDGRTLTFTIPEYVGACPFNPYDPPSEPIACIAIALQFPVGEHRLHVINANGTSNSVAFEVLPKRHTNTAN